MLYWLNIAYTVLFCIEMAAKVVAYGFLFGETAYIKSSWNILDGTLVLISIFEIVMQLLFAGLETGFTPVLRMLRIRSRRGEIRAAHRRFSHRC